ncbi:MAG: zinc-ribbon domain-containing protein [Methanobacterium formicicum]
MMLYNSICSNCGSRIEAGANFCSECGQKIKSTTN